MTAFTSHQPLATSTRSLPPTERDFEIYEAIHIAGCSTRSQAEKHEISQTRVRQIVRRVVEWLAQVIPPQAKVAKEQEIHLARQIAADRFQHQYEQMTTFWDMTRESKYAGLRLRITTAQARLGAVGGLLDGLAADAIEGIPVPAWQPPEPEPNSKSPFPNPKSSSSDADALHRPGPAVDPLPRNWELTSFDDLTPELVATLAAHGHPVPPGFIRYAQEHGRIWPRPDAESSKHNDPDATAGLCAVGGADGTPDSCSPTPCSPPVEDCSTDNESPDAAAEPLAENHSHSISYDTPTESTAEPIIPCSPPLTCPLPQPVTALHITPNQPGISVISPATTPQENQTSSNLPISLPSS